MNGTRICIISYIISHNTHKKYFVKPSKLGKMSGKNHPSLLAKHKVVRFAIQADNASCIGKIIHKHDRNGNCNLCRLSSETLLTSSSDHGSYGIDNSKRDSQGPCLPRRSASLEHLNQLFDMSCESTKPKCPQRLTSPGKSPKCSGRFGRQGRAPQQAFLRMPQRQISKDKNKDELPKIQSIDDSIEQCKQEDPPSVVLKQERKQKLHKSWSLSPTSATTTVFDAMSKTVFVQSSFPPATTSNCRTSRMPTHSFALLPTSNTKRLADKSNCHKQLASTSA